MEDTVVPIAVCGSLESFLIGQNVLQGRVHRRLAELTTNDAVTTHRASLVGGDAILLVLTTLHRVEDAFDLVIWPN